MSETTPTADMAQQVQVSSRRKAPEKKLREYRNDQLVPSGSTLVNLACSDNPYGAYGLGKIVTVPGSSSAGKTILMLTTFAEADKCEHLADYDFVYDDVEAALEIDVEYMFGRSVAARIQEPPMGPSNTIQNFKSNILQLSKLGTPYIYCLDSFDALGSDEELEKEMRKALAAAKSEEAAKKIAGSYGAEKAKIVGQTLRLIKQELKKTNSLLIMIQQIRQNMDAGPFSPKHTTSGGEAPFFYSTHQNWLTKIQTLKSRGRKIGSRVKADIRKNKLTGKLREVEFDIFYDYGVDNIGSMIDFLVEEEVWKEGTRDKKKGLIADGLDLFGTRPQLIQAIEEDGLEPELITITAAAWKDIENSLKLKRKPRYT